jgi:hypothetical protein
LSVCSLLLSCHYPNAIFYFPPDRPARKIKKILTKSYLEIVKGTVHLVDLDGHGRVILK